MRPSQINIIEPTLKDYSGHNYSFVQSLLIAGTGYRSVVWISRKSIVRLHNSQGVLIKRHFFRKIRKIQKYFLLKQLLKKDEIIFLSTAETIDLVILKWLSKNHAAFNRVYLYFHWFRDSKKKRRRLASLSRCLGEINILVPTDSIGYFFTECGFNNVRTVPYPHTKPIETQTGSDKKFKCLLYAGAARVDKGFLRVVDFVDYLAETGEIIPIVIQITQDHGKKHSQAVADAIKRLENSVYKYIELVQQTPSTEDYFGFYDGSICIQLYNSEEFADRISGVTLDALSQGAPIVTTSGTWISKNVVPFSAGLEIAANDNSALLKAIKVIIENYSTFSESASNRGMVLQKVNDAKNLSAVVSEKLV